MDGLSLPPVARLEYEHGDVRVVVEVPPEQTSELLIVWKDLVFALSTPYIVTS